MLGIQRWGICCQGQDRQQSTLRKVVVLQKMQKDSTRCCTALRCSTEYHTLRRPICSRRPLFHVTGEDLSCSTFYSALRHFLFSLAIITFGRNWRHCTWQWLQK